jgi:phage I-like protein
MSKHIAALAFSIAAANAADGSIAAEWIDDTSAWMRVLPVGEFAAADGRPTNLKGLAHLKSWRLTAVRGQQLVAALNARKSQVVVDYEHQTLHSEQNGQPAPASGWMQEFQWRDNGLWARIKWTEKAAAMLRAGEYRYLSPVFPFDKHSGEVTDLLHAALTNFPGVHGLTDAALHRVAARYSTNPEDSTTMKLLAICRAVLALADTATEAEVETGMQALADRLKPTDGAAALSAVTVLDNQTTSIAALTAKVPTETVVPITQLVTVQTALAAANTEIASLKAAAKTSELDTLIAGAISEGRILPASEAHWRTEGEKDLAALKTTLAMLPPIAALSGTQTGNKQPAPVTSAAQLNDDQLAVCKNLGITPEAFAKSLAANAAGA